MPKLQRVCLRETSVTGVTIRALLDGLPAGQLKFLNLAGSTLISADAIHWARSKGVIIKCGTVDSGKGFRVRFG